MSLLNIGYGLGGFMKGLNEQQNQQLLQQLSRLDLQRVQQQIRAQQQYDATAPLLYNYYLNQQDGGQTPAQPSVPQFGGGLTYGSGAPTPPAAAQPSSPPQLGGGPDLSSYGGAGVNFTGSPGAFIGSPNGGGGLAPGFYRDPNTGMLTRNGQPPDLYMPDPSAPPGSGSVPMWRDDDSSGPRTSANPTPNLGPGDPGFRVPRGPLPGAGRPFTGTPGPGAYTIDSSGNLVDMTTGGPLSDLLPMQQASPTSDIPAPATAPSSPPGFSGSSAAAGPPPSAGGDGSMAPMRQMYPRGGMDRVLNLIERDESGGQNIPNYRYDAGHTAQGNFQITNTTWRETAPKAGVDINQYPTAMSAPYPVQRAVAARLLQERGTQPWADFNPKLAADLRGGRTGGGTGGGVAAAGAGGGGGANDAIMQQAIGLIQKGLAPVPESMFGNMTAHQMAVQIEKANPNADPVVKMLALERGMKMMAPQERLRTEAYMQQHQDEFRLGLALLQSQLAGERQMARQEGSGPIVTQDGKSYRVGPDNVLHPLTIEGQGGAPATGVSKLGTGSGDLPPPDPSSVKILKSMLEAGLNPPSYMARGKQGQSNLNAAMQEMGKEGKTGGQIAQARGDVAANKASQTNLTRVYDTVKAYAGLADKNIAAAEKMAEDTVPTDFGPFLNRWIMSGQMEFGDEKVPGYTMQVITASNELARVLSASTGAAAMTDSARREAAEMLSPYFSAGQFKQAAKVARAEIARRLGELESGIKNIRERTAAPGTAPGQTPAGAQQTPAVGGPPATGLPSDLPDPSGLPDGATAKDDQGNVIAIIKSGQWANP